jgi:ribosomal protein L11 methyltransferase
VNKVFLNLSSEEVAIVEIALDEAEQTNWTIEKAADCVQLCGYFEEDFQGFWQELQGQIPLLREKTLTQETIQPCDWQEAYKEFLVPFRMGPLHIVPVWRRQDYAIPDRQFAIYLDAEMAFGTGSHETTKLCLARIIDYGNLFKNAIFLKKMIDVGCGSGILSIAATKLKFAHVYGFDNDPNAIKISKKNAEQNGAPSIEFALADINEGILGRQADLIVANILAPVLIKNASVLVNSVKQYGILSLGGLLNEEVESVRAIFGPLVERYWSGSICNVKTMGQWSEVAYVRT